MDWSAPATWIALGSLCIAAASLWTGICLRRRSVRLLDGMERLITEHGSAAILLERVALAREQYAALETKHN
jgi:hypothetical protein